MRVDVALEFSRVQVLSDVYSERSLLAAILFDQRALEHLADLEPVDFWLYQHGAIFQAIRNVQEVGADVTVETVFAELLRAARPHCECEWIVVDLLSSRLAMDASPEELRWHFGHVRRARLRREALAA